MRIPASAFGGSAGDLIPEATGTPLVRTAALVLPQGSTIVAFRSQCARRNAGDTAEVVLANLPQFLGSPPIWTAIGGVTHTHGVDASDYTTEETTGLAQTVGAGARTISVELEAASDVADARLSFVEVDYRGP